MFSKTRSWHLQSPFDCIDFRLWFKDVRRASEMVQGLISVREIRVFEDQVGISSGCLASGDTMPKSRQRDQ